MHGMISVAPFALPHAYWMYVGMPMRCPIQYCSYNEMIWFGVLDSAEAAVAGRLRWWVGIATG